MLADLVDDKNEGLPQTSAAKKLKGAVDDLVDADRRIPTALGMCPRVGGWVGHRIKSVQNRTGPG